MTRDNDVAAKSIDKPGEPASCARVRITPTIERDYKARGVFWKLRLSRAVRIVGGATGVYDLPIDEARQVLADAQAQHKAGSEVRGMRTAYGALVRALSPAIREEEGRGLWKAPNHEDLLFRIESSSARLNIGDRAMDESDAEVTISDEYAFRKIFDPSGEFIDERERRCSFRWGYLAVDGEGEECFYPAHELRALDGSVRHLRLVSANPS